MFSLVVGFFVGIIYENIVSQKYGASVNIFNEFYLKQYIQMEIIYEDYIWYLFQKRGILLAILCVSCITKAKKIICILFLCWFGILGGIFTVSAVFQLGVKGILICICTLIPHMVCYGIAYAVLLSNFYFYPEKKWNSSKIIFVAVMFLLGILLEGYLNPALMKIIFRII